MNICNAAYSNLLNRTTTSFVINPIIENSTTISTSNTTVALVNRNNHLPSISCIYKIKTPIYITGVKSPIYNTKSSIYDTLGIIAENTLVNKGGDIIPSPPSPPSTPYINMLLSTESKPFTDRINSHIEVNIRAFCLDETFILFDLNDSSGRYLSMLYYDIRYVWLPFASEIYGNDDTKYNGIRFFMRSRVVHELYHLNEMLFTPLLLTPREIYSEHGFELINLHFTMSMFGPSYDRWVFMQREFGLILKTEGEIINLIPLTVFMPLRISTPIYLYLNFYSVRDIGWFNSDRDLFIHYGIDPNLF